MVSTQFSDLSSLILKISILRSIAFNAVTNDTQPRPNLTIYFHYTHSEKHLASMLSADTVLKTL
jgi:hypothetical protein